ncbi:hypothetical protein HNY73_022370 [Argiope bruennichi]|uniref:Uncharacterized protein n=2 Tax=Argiope bruennichi TaxID=94029 RepID=A0A8T0E318_ARGBR|nr:hypothetical protein HNY73_022370 [Argiope bruennichi]
MAMEISDPTLSTPNLNTLWKSSNPERIADHKLKCVLKKDEEPSIKEESEIEKSLKNLNNVISNLETKIQTLDAQQNSIIFRQTMQLCLTVLFMAIFLGHIFLHSDSFWPSILDKYF